MAIREILIAPEQRLKTRAAEVAQVDAGIRQLMDDLAETMYDAPGYGLAAPQVGVLQRVITVDCRDEAGEAQLFQMANPEIVWASEDQRIAQEGCLSVPEQFADIARSAEVTVAYLDRHNQRQETRADGLLAACLQHEIDHLNGVLFFDRLGPMKRNTMLRKARRYKRTQETA